MALVSVVRSVFAFTLFTLFSTGPVCAQTGLGFGMAGVSSGQSARLSALNLGGPRSNQDSACSITLRFLDGQGQVLKESAVSLGAGKSASVDLSRAQMTGTTPRLQIRAVLLFGYSGGAAPGPGALTQFDCNIVPTLEVFDNDTGKTSFIVTDAKPLPIPDPRSVAGAQVPARKAVE